MVYRYIYLGLAKAARSPPTTSSLTLYHRSMAEQHDQFELVTVLLRIIGLSSFWRVISMCSLERSLFC